MIKEFVSVGGCLFDATADLLRTNPSPADLFDRFIGWTARR